MERGHPMYRINFPTANKSWEYDALTKVWSERQSGLSGGRHRGETAIAFGGGVKVFDYENGNIYTLNAATETENGTGFPMELTSRRITFNYDPGGIDRVFIDMETGMDSAINPQITLRVSRDGGHSWGNEMPQSLGETGQYFKRAEWRQLGTSENGFVLRFRITDPVKRRIVGAGVW